MSYSHDVPYSSQEARSRAAQTLDLARRGGGFVGSPPAPIDEFLFSVGQHREGQTADIEEAHHLIPPLLAPRRRSGDTVEQSLAQRLNVFLRVMERRITDLLAANNRELERRREAERNVARLEQENEDLGEELRRRPLRIGSSPFPTHMALDDLETREIGAGIKGKALATRGRDECRTEALDAAPYAFSTVRRLQAARDATGYEALLFLKNNWNLLPHELRNSIRNFIRYENEGAPS